MTARIVISSGEPAGIGPDITLKALQANFGARIAVTGNAEMLKQRAQALGLDMKIEILKNPDDMANHTPGSVQVISSDLYRPSTAGELNPENSQYVINCINLATDGCLAAHYDAMVTAPVHKGIINDAGIAFSGHTEWIAERCGDFQPVMMLADDSVRVCLATTHLPLSQVPQAITHESLSNILTIMDHDLKRLYGISHPFIAVCGLNPHAGEGGYLGMEEIETITPVIHELRSNGLNLVGPVPADTIFTKHNLQDIDAVLAMYHDQGLPVVKHSGFGEVVNITMGIPIIRTSVDHGTALDLAATGKASATSLETAINVAIQFANNR